MKFTQTQLLFLVCSIGDIKGLKKLLKKSTIYKNETPIKIQ